MKKFAVIADKRVIAILIIFLLSLFSFSFTSILLQRYTWEWFYLLVIATRILLSILIFADYKVSWSRASVRTGAIKVFICIATFVIILIPAYFYDISLIPLLFFENLLFGFFHLIIVFGYRSFYHKSNKKNGRKVVIYGAGKAGVQIAMELIDNGYRVYGFVDDDPNLKNRSVDGFTIFSREAIIDNLSDVRYGSKKIDLLMIAMPSVKDNKIINNIFTELKPFFNDIKILPNTVKETLIDTPFLKKAREISVRDVLEREPRSINQRIVGDFLKDKVVMVTGAGGSIGSEICRQCIKYKCKRLLMVDHSEYSLYKINEELAKHYPLAFLTSVVDRKVLEPIFDSYRPDIVLHAAAYKHVPLVEYNIDQSIFNNIIGAKNCIDFSVKYEVDKFILISTDKAVRPTNVMGATKRICEIYAQSSSNFRTKISSVRFGNVLGSSGSVIPKFKKQIDEGGPITVTHPEINRFFMLIPEACGLVLQAGAISEGKEIFILDMGNPIKISDLAKKMIELSGKDIDIIYTGLRPGEKLYEELLVNETDKQTDFEHIQIAKVADRDLLEISRHIENLIQETDKISYLREIVPDFNHKYFTLHDNKKAHVTM